MQELQYELLLCLTTFFCEEERAMANWAESPPGRRAEQVWCVPGWKPGDTLRYHGLRPGAAGKRDEHQPVLCHAQSRCLATQADIAGLKGHLVKRL